MKRIFVTAGMAAALARPAMADDLAITSQTTTAAATSTASNASPGNITVATGGSVAVSVTSAAVTLDSNNSVVNNGAISNAAGTNAVGVNILAGNTGSFLNSGNITISGIAVTSGNVTATTGQSAILLNGTGAFTGDITTAASSNINISGLAAQGIAIRSQLVGNLTVGGNVQSNGTSANGISILGNVTGTFSNLGTITASGGGTSTTIINPTSGASVSIGGSIQGGLLNAGPVSASDTTPVASITASGDVPALLIAPSIAGNVGAINFGILPDAQDPGNSLINRGRIANDGTQPAINTTALQIGNSVSDTLVLTTLQGPLLNAGTIEASATSSNQNATSVTATISNATAIEINKGAVIPTLVNSARGTISATTGGPVGGTATALSIASGAQLRALNNAGSIIATANTTATTISSLTAQAILDSSGILTSVTNSGSIIATATTLDNNAQATVAANLSASSLPIAFYNSGTVTGDILFGSSTGNTLTIEGSQAIVNGQITTKGPGRVSIAISQAGTGGTLTTRGPIQASSLTVGPGGTLNLGITNTNGISATGPITFDAASRLVVTPLALLPSDATLTLLHSDNALTFGNYSATVQAVQIPYLFNGGLTVDAQNLTLTLQRKSVSELGLTGNDAVVFVPATVAASADNALGAAFSTLGSAEELHSVLSELVPVVNGAAQAAADTITNSTTDAVAVRQRMLTMTPEVQNGASVWAQGLYARYDDSSATAYSGDATGGTIGIEYGRQGTGHFGIGFTFSSAKADESARLASIDSTWFVASPYLGFRLGNAFINAQLNIGAGRLRTERSVNVGSLSFATQSVDTQWLASGGITGGYVFSLGHFKLAPQINLNGLDLGPADYTEQGGGTGVDLTVKQKRQQSVRVFAGADFNAAYQAFGGRFVPEIFGGWSQELLTPSNTVDASFAGVSGTAFSIAGPVEQRSRFVGSGSLAYVADSWSVAINYDRTLESRMTAQSARLTVASRF